MILCGSEAQFLDASPVVERYAWFTDRWDADPTISLLMPNASALTPTGQVLPLFTGQGCIDHHSQGQAFWLPACCSEMDDGAMQGVSSP